MWLDLGGVGVPFEAKLLNKVRGNLEPVMSRVSYLVGIQIASSSVKLATDLNLL